MSEGQHPLIEAFPDYRDEISQLKTSDAHFRKLFDEYHAVTKSIERSEQRLDLLTEREEELLRKKRLQLKDELFGLLRSVRKG